MKRVSSENHLGTAIWSYNSLMKNKRVPFKPVELVPKLDADDYQGPDDTDTSGEESCDSDDSTDESLYRYSLVKP